MYGFKIANGDIQVGYDGSVSKVTGTDRIAQDLACWLLEPLGTDTVYRRFGSNLSWKIGQPLTKQTLSEIRNEVKRVVENYITYTTSAYKQAAKQGTAYFTSAWGGDAIPTSLVSISVEGVADTATVAVKLATTQGTVTVTQTL